MYKINNLLDNPNIKITYEMGPVRILEHQRNMSTANLYDVGLNYRLSQMNVRNRQALITLDDSAFKVSAGAMQWTVGQVALQTGVKGVGDFVGKAFSGLTTGESVVKPVYSGTGLLMLEPTMKYLFPLRVEEWGGIVLDDGAYLGCEDSVSISVRMNKNLRTATAGGEGVFNMVLDGKGVVIVESPVPYAHLAEIELDNDVMCIDGNMAVAWSASLQFSTELAAKMGQKKGFFDLKGMVKDAVASGASGEGYINVYRGTGKILLALIEKSEPSANALPYGER